MRRLGCLLLTFVVSFAWAQKACAGPESAEVTLDYVAKKAEDRARRPFHSPRADLPDILRADKLDYDKYREIRFRHEQALWAAEKLPFAMEFFHPGYLYEEPVHINEFSYTYVQPVRFVQEFFDYGKLHIKKQIPANTGYAGFRVLYPLNQTDKQDELGAFLGASYFRLLGKGQRYGASARGFALDCGESDRPEEFPIFTDWWLGKPQADDKELHLFAILDSVSCAGAYEFRIRPGETTVAEIEAVIYLREADKISAVDPQRKPLLTMGLAPLTSMFWFGEGSERKFDDYRPEVHDSDGLLVRMENGETLWRPLNNASVMRHQRFGAKNIRGFGLLQRDREFASYQDIFNPYHLVPSLWVEPRGHWGEGDLHLVELSTHYEGLDNIVAFWEPKTKPLPMQPFRFSYALYWTRETDLKLSVNKVVATRIGADPRDPQRRQIVIDFTGPKLAALPEGTLPTAIASCSENGRIVGDNQVFQMASNSVWRAIIEMEPKPDNKDPIDLRCTLQKGEEILTETWTYHWSPP
ncbi:MAG: glucan biosynthesis protein [Pedosphaera sp.]|nr:glucan biosynthesis protein [Pedosphaera sp.]